MINIFQNELIPVIMCDTFQEAYDYIGINNIETNTDHSIIFISEDRSIYHIDHKNRSVCNKKYFTVSKTIPKYQFSIMEDTFIDSDGKTKGKSYEIHFTLSSSNKIMYLNIKYLLNIYNEFLRDEPTPIIVEYKDPNKEAFELSLKSKIGG